MAICAPKYVQETSVRIPGHTWHMKKGATAAFPFIDVQKMLEDSLFRMRECFVLIALVL